jgi:Nin one binding (NOB1) Zn-ribbon like
MGLRLVSKGGAEITTLHRSVLRCDGCGTVCKSQSKVFCPACGHATLSKVSVTVGSDGTEHIGVRKRFTLRGTRYYSLPSFDCPIQFPQGSLLATDFFVNFLQQIGSIQQLHMVSLMLAFLVQKSKNRYLLVCGTLRQAGGGLPCYASMLVLFVHIFQVRSNDNEYIYLISIRWWFTAGFP